MAQVIAVAWVQSLAGNLCMPWMSPPKARSFLIVVISTKEIKSCSRIKGGGGEGQLAGGSRWSRDVNNETHKIPKTQVLCGPWPQASQWGELKGPEHTCVSPKGVALSGSFLALCPRGISQGLVFFPASAPSCLGHCAPSLSFSPACPRFQDS